MRYLFLIISFLYSFIFYLFYLYSNWKDFYFFRFINNDNINHYSIRDPIIYFVDFKNHPYIQSIFWNLLIETIIFLILWIVFFLYFSWTSIESKNQVFIDNMKKYLNLDFKSIFIKILKNFSYYIGFILFYISLYILSLWINVQFSIFILFINLLIIILYFIFKNNILFKNFLRINSTIFSFIYILFYLYIFITKNNFFSFIELFNSILIIFSFLTLIVLNKKSTDFNNYDNVIIINFLIYLFFVFLFYTNFYILNWEMLFSFIIHSSIFWIVLFEFLSRYKYFASYEVIIKYIWIIFSYLWIFFSYVYLLKNFSILIFLLLILYVFYNYYIHLRYTNYVSFFLSVFSLYFVIFYSLFNFFSISYKSFTFFVISVAFSYFLILFTYVKKIKLIFDIYFLHFFSYFINIVSVFIFVFANFDKLNFIYVWFLLFLESIYFFLSYNKLHDNNLRLWKTQ